MNQRARGIIDRLQQQLDADHAPWAIHLGGIVGTGLDFLVVRADSRMFGPIAIKVPWRRWISNDNDDDMDTRAILAQEAELADHVRRFGVPTPAVHWRQVSDQGLDFLICELVEHDLSPPDPGDFGRVLRSLHDCPVVDIPLVAHAGGTLGDILIERITRRAGVVRAATGLELPLERHDALRAHLNRPGKRLSILHMDARPANLLTRRHRICAVVDWANALIGDPMLELARIAEYGHLDAGFEDGYGDVRAVFERASRVEELLYRIDTAVMLAVVFLSEAPDPERATRQLERVRQLYEQLGHCAAWQ